MSTVRVLYEHPHYDWGFLVLVVFTQSLHWDVIWHNVEFNVGIPSTYTRVRTKKVPSGCAGIGMSTDPILKWNEGVLLRVSVPRDQAPLNIFPQLRLCLWTETQMRWYSTLHVPVCVIYTCITSIYIKKINHRPIWINKCRFACVYIRCV